MASAPENLTPAHERSLLALNEHRDDPEFMAFLRRRLAELEERPPVRPMTAEEFRSEYPLSDT
jgi:hypothetical protein